MTFRKIMMQISIVIACLWVATGCTGQDHHRFTRIDEDVRQKQENVGNKDRSSAVPPITTSAPAAIPEAPPELTADAAIKLMDEARDRNYKLLQKGGPCDDFKYINDEDGGYAFICDELNSKEKIQKYLEEVFTSPIADTIIGQLNLRKVDNKLAFSPLDWGSMYDWSSIKVTKTKKDGNKATFLFKVGLFDASVESKTIEITFKYIDKSGWRVDTEPQHFL
ncbi:IseA DL-endopeptidase inhibitor family protein [Paenibacillus sp. MZ04-78.2]|uniref:IseA DL-endopeptidase inhibitor family protein n=1 Tax=Paenibacillus sp. MZ04-78.2 TaxID=2962034 RepID=UPI0020B79711|nr:IseA DL-endopeptidase inhibitor family protein [Paenibacillus sp. MZ04-78.2]MCP3773643.1 IseA DL-endopeptidase inhibitor family protein [Paenibacillus sp. MZ04-78.2]